MSTVTNQQCNSTGDAAVNTKPLPYNSHEVLSLAAHRSAQNIIYKYVTMSIQPASMKYYLEVSALPSFAYELITHVVLISQRLPTVTSTTILLIVAYAVQQHQHDLAPLTVAATHLLDVEVRRHRQVLSEQSPVDQLNSSQYRRPLLVGLDFLKSRHNALIGPAAHHALQRVQTVPCIAGLSPLTLALLQHKVQQVVLKVHAGQEGAAAHAHDLPALSSTVRLGVLSQLLHDLQALHEHILSECLREAHLLVAHVAQQRLADGDSVFDQVLTQLYQGLVSHRVLPHKHALLLTLLVQEGTLGVVSAAPQAR
eukprot:11422-Heterococcus_DN1.PRE.1